MNLKPALAYHVDMREAEQTVPSPEVPTTLLVCPICWSHEGVEEVHGIVLSAKATGGRNLTGVSLYRCPRWHLFALFNPPKEWEL